MGVTPGLGGGPHAAGSYSLRTTTAETQVPGACAPPQAKPPPRAVRVHHSLRKPVCSNEDPAQPKVINNFQKTGLYTVHLGQADMGSVQQVEGILNCGGVQA